MLLVQTDAAALCESGTPERITTPRMLNQWLQLLRTTVLSTALYYGRQHLERILEQLQGDERPQELTSS
jgi:hypothetical protein